MEILCLRCFRWTKVTFTQPVNLKSAMKEAGWNVSGMSDISDDEEAIVAICQTCGTLTFDRRKEKKND